MKFTQNLSARARAGVMILVLLSCPVAAVSDEDMMPDKQVLTALLHAFLAGASRNDPMAHDKFWSEQLVYTSSGGARFGKAEIMQSLESPDEESPMVYTAEEIQIQQFGDTAVVAFKLVARPLETDSSALQYFNTGTFVKGQGRWQAVAWQATRIPGEQAESDS